MHHHRYCFYTEDACQYGLHCAVIIDKLAHHCEKNWLAQHNIHQDSQGIQRAWVDNSADDWAAWFGYLTKHQIEYALNTLVKKGVLIKGRFIKKNHDRASGYAFADQKKYFNRLTACQKANPKTAKSVELAEKKQKSINPANDDEKAALLAWFEQSFWPRYPVKKEKFRTKKAMLKLNPSPALQATIMAGLMNQLMERQLKASTGQWAADWKHPSTWLNNRCWEDEVQLVAREPGIPNNQAWQTYLAKNRSMIEMGYVTEQQLYQLWLEDINPTENNDAVSRGGQWIDGEVIP